MITREELLEYFTFARNYTESVLMDTGSMSPVVGVWMDGKPFLWVFPPAPGEAQLARDAILHVARACIIGMGPDGLSLTVDTYRSMSPVKTNGEPWMAGEMEKARSEGTEDADLVGDALQMVYIDALKNVGAITQGYVVTDTGTGSQKLTWEDMQVFIEGEPDGPANELGGIMIEAIREFYDAPDLLDTLRSTNEGLQTPEGPISIKDWVRANPEEAFARRACMVIKMALLPIHASVVMGTDDPTVAAIFMEHFPPGEESTS